jgi:hypothetical protein
MFKQNGDEKDFLAFDLERLGEDNGNREGRQDQEPKNVSVNT